MVALVVTSATHCCSRCFFFGSEEKMWRRKFGPKVKEESMIVGDSGKSNCVLKVVVGCVMDVGERDGSR